MAKKTKVTAGAATNGKQLMNIVILGTSATGKTALATAFLFNIFQAYHTPTVDGVFTGEWKGAPPLELTVLEPGCAGDQALQKLRLCHTPIDVFLIVFSLVDQKTMHDATNWARLARDATKDVPFLLVGCKKDLRPRTLTLDSTQRSEVLEDEGRKMSSKIDAKAYVECSALTGEGVGKVFETAIAMGGWAAPASAV